VYCRKSDIDNGGIAMNEQVFIIKVLNEETGRRIINYAKESLKNEADRYYNPTSIDEGILASLKTTTGLVVIVVYHIDESSNCEKIDEMMIGLGEVNEHLNITYKMKVSTTSPLVINNFVSNSEIDLKNDFGKASYVTVARSKVLIRQLEFIVNPPYIPKQNQNQEYKNSYNNQKLDELAQHNNNCRRMIGQLEEAKDRSEFQRDRERIVNSKAFRRLVDKAQIFTSSKGDHYRTRMTHTLEVAQISKAIATSLGLNVDLTEGIALAHDLGHTPFGHQGERTLDLILKNRHDVIQFPNNIKIHNEFGGFKHNYQGVRVLTHLEEKYIDYSGLDLSYQVLEGVLKHTGGKLKNCICCEKCDEKCFEIPEFMEIDFIDKLYPEQKFASTLEGQAVAIADEIAQRGHDIDDAFSSRLLDETEFLDSLDLKSMEELNTIISQSFLDIKESKRCFVDENELIRARIISDIVGYFLQDVIKESQIKKKKFEKDEEYFINHRFTSEIIMFSDTGKRANAYLEKIVSKKAINSLEVSKFDNNAEAIILALFKAYYNNPKLLHKGTLQRVYLDIRNHLNPYVSNNVIDFNNGDFNLVKKELNLIAKRKIPESDTALKIEDWSYQDIEYWEKRKILVRNISDYISGMTDSYALNEYNSIMHKK
jgi:dGTPase